jgi:hypothetical protein
MRTSSIFVRAGRCAFCAILPHPITAIQTFIKKLLFLAARAAVFSDFIIRLFLSSVNTLAFGFV